MSGDRALFHKLSPYNPSTLPRTHHTYNVFLTSSTDLWVQYTCSQDLSRASCITSNMDALLALLYICRHYNWISPQVTESRDLLRPFAREKCLIAETVVRVPFVSNTPPLRITWAHGVHPRGCLATWRFFSRDLFLLLMITRDSFWLNVIIFENSSSAPTKICQNHNLIPQLN